MDDSPVSEYYEFFADGAMLYYQLNRECLTGGTNFKNGTLNKANDKWNSKEMKYSVSEGFIYINGMPIPFEQINRNLFRWTLDQGALNMMRIKIQE